VRRASNASARRGPGRLRIAQAHTPEGGRQLLNRYCFQPMTQPGEMKQTFVEQRLTDVTETELMIRMDYQNFDDYWAPRAS
jgi:hypothetical protein